MRRTLSRIRAFFNHGLWDERPTSSGPAASARHAVRALALSVRSFVGDRCVLHATALAYTTLLSLVPLLALVFALAKGFGAQDQLRPVIDRWLAANQEQVGERLTEFIEKTTDYVRNTPVGVLGGVGLLLLVWTTIKVLGTIERSFNDIWRVRRSRTLVRKFTDYLSVLVISPLLLVAATSIGAAFRTSAVARAAFSGVFLGRAMELTLVLVPTWVAFAAVYVFMPNTRVRLRSGLAGGIVAGTVWQAAFWLYTTFQIGMARYNAVYGTFAALPVFMIWLYLSWAVVLFGAEVSWAAQNVGRYCDERRAAAANFAAREAVALRSMAALAVAFHRDGAALTAARVAEGIRAPQALTLDVLRALTGAGLCSEVVRPDGRAFQPGRPLEKIVPADVLRAVREHGEAVPLEGGGDDAAVVGEILDAYSALCDAGLGKPSFHEIASRLGGAP